MRHLHNELIASPDDGGLVGARHAITNDVIISDTMLRSLAPPQLRPMTDNHKIMCGCAICNTSKYMQESLNAWRRKQLENHKRKKQRIHVEEEKMNELNLANHMLTMYFQRKKLVIHVAKMQQILFFLNQLMMNLNCPIGNLFCGSVLSVVLFFSQQLKWIHKSEHQ